MSTYHLPRRLIDWFTYWTFCKSGCVSSWLFPRKNNFVFTLYLSYLFLHPPWYVLHKYMLVSGYLVNLECTWETGVVSYFLQLFLFCITLESYLLCSVRAKFDYLLHYVKNALKLRGLANKWRAQIFRVQIEDLFVQFRAEYVQFLKIIYLEIS